MTQYNVFFVGLDDFNLATLKNLPQAADCTFHAALHIDEMRGVGDLDIPALVETAAARMAAVPGGAHAVTSFFDFPGTLIAAMLAERFGLPGPGLEAVLKCENKYWSRLEQQKVVPDNIPAFAAFDPHDDSAYERIGLIPPFWIKPIKSFRSYLAFKIGDPRQFDDAVAICRDKGAQLADPFRTIMEQADIAPEIAGMAESFIAESSIGGAQCTLEGYAHDGRIVGYGVVDSIREADSSSFARYEYPSMLPLEVQHRMIDVARSVMTQIGYENGTFNIEFFYDQTNDQVWLLEINPRASQSHADLFEKVHGVSHLSVMVDLALGRKPKPFQRTGQFNVAAHFFVRAFEPGIVTRVPTADALKRLHHRQPSTRLKLAVERGTDLASLENQDSYSYELAEIYIGGRDRAEVLDRYDEAMTALQFEIERETLTQVT
ncbi:ATP-grasp domain-containing protein [Rhodothalassium salexigens]|uniref:ATP-grasp domain-containing protein n=1 Tax=Rhodothalassium salexigens TaxID=1086 RepID=UPI0019131370